MNFTYHQAIEATRTFLRCHNKDLEHFHETHGIKGKTDGKHIILDYDQITVKWSEPYGYVCRGLVLNAETLDVLCAPLQKFFNLGEEHAAEINWDSAKFLEKLDGSMVCRWWSPHTQRFEHSTRFQLPGDLEVNKVGMTGSTWKILIDKALDSEHFSNNLCNQQLSYVFEVMSPYNQVVVQHQKVWARLIAQRNNETFKETLEPFNLTNGPRSFSFSSKEEMIKFTKTLKGSIQEGIVVVDNNFNRLKVKGDDYARLHILRDKTSIRALMAQIRDGNVEEVCTYFPHCKPQVDKIEEVMESFLKQHTQAYEVLKNIQNQKEFAMALNSMGLHAPWLLFNVRSGKAKNVRESLFNSDEHKFIRTLEPIVKKEGLVLDEQKIE